MNAKRVLGLALLIVFAMVAVAAAAPGTNKARGVYNRGGWELNGGPARHRYTQRAPAIYHAPIVRAAPAPQVAQAPVEGRRFSYAPANQAVTLSPCPPVTSFESGRRYSYAPSAGAAVVPQASEPRVYYSQPSYSTGRRSTGHQDLWALPKTDPRKSNSR
jgi:hypothetical protein